MCFSQEACNCDVAFIPNKQWNNRTVLLTQNYLEQKVQRRWCVSARRNVRKTNTELNAAWQPNQLQITHGQTTCHHRDMALLASTNDQRGLTRTPASHTSTGTLQGHKQAGIPDILIDVRKHKTVIEKHLTSSHPNNPIKIAYQTARHLVLHHRVSEIRPTHEVTLPEIVTPFISQEH